MAWSRCAEGEGVPGFWPWTQVLRATGGLPGGEDHLAPSAAGMTREAADRFRIFDRVVRHLAEAAAESGLLVVLDDLHWADPDSLGLLEFAARQLAVSRLLLVGAYRDDDARRPSPSRRGDGRGEPAGGSRHRRRWRTDGTNHRRPGARGGRRSHALPHRRQPAVRP